ncbi:SIS domain-containing protein, partial [Candidatus Saccharibacteria bacterium]|nr:SIS domain-containing protein [Candidatus Saccharibacteria bacterium]
LEGALKLKEISYTDANAYPTGELKHGPIALVDDNAFEFFLLPENDLYDKALSGLEEVLARGGHAIVVTDSAKFEHPVEEVIRVKTSLKLLTPLLLNVVSQLFAYNFAVAKGLPVDQPRNLAKSVTVE